MKHKKKIDVKQGITVRFSLEDIQRIHDVSNNQNISVSKYIRECVLLALDGDLDVVRYKYILDTIKSLQALNNEEKERVD